MVLNTEITIIAMVTALPRDIPFTSMTMPITTQPKIACSLHGSGRIMRTRSAAIAGSPRTLQSRTLGNELSVSVPENFVIKSPQTGLTNTDWPIDAIGRIPTCQLGAARDADHL